MKTKLYKSYQSSLLCIIGVGAGAAYIFNPIPLEHGVARVWPGARPRVRSGDTASALWANHLKGWWFFWNWSLLGLQGVEVCAGLLQSVPMGSAECVQGYRVCAGCSFNILPCSTRLNQKIFY